MKKINPCLFRTSLGHSIKFCFNSLFFVLFLILFHVKAGYSQQLNANQVTINNTNIAEGYISLRIPIYGSDDNDEGITPTAERAGKIVINGESVLRFWSFKKEGEGQSNADWYWVRAQRCFSDVYAYVYQDWGTEVWKSIRFHGTSFSNSDYTQANIDENDDEEVTWAQIRVCIPARWLETDLSVYVTYFIDEDGGGDAGQSTSATSNFSKLSFSKASLSHSLSSTPGKVDVGISLSSLGVYETYEYSINNGGYNTFDVSPQTVEMNISRTEQVVPVDIRYTLGFCSTEIVKSNSVTIPAYPQAEELKASQQPNGDTQIEWKVYEDTGDNYESGDQFDIQRADNAEFTNAIDIGTVLYEKDHNRTGDWSTYTFFDETSEENLNGKYYYRVRRSKTANSWGWDVCNVTSLELKMAHSYISDASVMFDRESNVAHITWNYDDGDVWSKGTDVVIERTNLTNGSSAEIIVVPSDSLGNQSYSEKLYLMCNKFSYAIYVRPGSSNYKTQDAVNVEGDNVVPVETGNVLSINASKGYFSERTELSWKTDGNPIDYFSVSSRIYQSGNEYKQIAQVDGGVGSSLYQYNDEQSNPGVIYEYRIVGITNCADVTVSTDTLYTYGFRTPTGDIYGRVAFESGQAEENVEVRLETEEDVMGQSLNFTEEQYAIVNDTSFLKNNTDSLSVQAWVAPDDLSGTRKIFSKPGMYELGINEGYFYFTVGTQTLKSATPVSSGLADADFIHLSGVYSNDSLLIYINGERTDSISFSGTLAGGASQVVLGENYVGAIDEVRVWNVVLSKAEIERDYNRYITGGENGLMAYWTFNYATDTEFFDRSYKNSTYNEQHGQLVGDVSVSKVKIPTNEQLGYKGVSGKDGSYSIRSIPYAGNGTVYSIIPRLGIHEFEPQQEIRFIGAGSESFTVNFTDKSSFRVTGTVTYEGGTVPVEGVSFTIDGVVSVGSNGTVIMTDAQGKFEISVPVGSHSVVATKVNHRFENEGKITDSYGVDLNYQDEVLGLELTDITKVRFIGRVAGGAEQDAYILGHSLSTNNLADGVSVTLTTKNAAYWIASEDTTLVFDHLIPSNKSGDTWPKTNSVNYGKEAITIFPNVETGEFIADVLPISYTVTINVPGHGDIPGSGDDLDLAQSLIENTIVNEYTDSVLVDGEYVKEAYSDTVYYNQYMKSIKRYAPTIRISQLDNSEKELAYFGDTLYSVTSLDGTETNLKLYDNGNYTLGKPVFTQNAIYNLKTEVFEKYVYYGTNGKLKDGAEIDEVPTQDATVEFTNNLAINDFEEVEADSLGIAFYSFQVTEPELTSGIRKLSSKIYYGSGDDRTSINWDGAFDGIILGAVQTGRDFVTGGPDKVLLVLRDPPGSNSYSYMEKGVTVSESSTYNGSAVNSGSELFTQDLGTSLVTWAGVGAGTIQTVETESGWTLGVVHKETISGSNSKSVETTTTTRFETSSEDSYVGADADVFVGYSTNIAYGATNCVSIISRSQYLNDPSKYEVYKNITPLGSSWYLVKQVGLGVAQTFGTMFAYPQKYIENRLLPEMEALRDNFLMQLPENMSFDDLQQLANEKDTTFYVSYLDVSNINFGKSNSDDVFKEFPDLDPDDPFNGPSYRVVYPERDDFTRTDTILYLNQSIDNWYKQLEANEKAKIDATMLQNYSFQGGAPISYSESYAYTESSTVSFDVMIGGNFSTEVGLDIMGSGFNLKINETVTTTHGGAFENAETESHCKGFVLSESDDDYLSVDVMHENAEFYEDDSDSKNNFYPTFVFRTQAGATSCPYEDQNVTKYYEPGDHVIDQATKQIEVPEIAVETDFIENVPSGEVAYFTLYLRNNSEIQQENWFTLKMIDSSNPDGAKLFVDGAAIGNGHDFLVPADGTLIKTLEVGKGSALNYDNLKLVLQSQCQDDIADTLNFSVHFTPSCSDVNLENPGNQWTYNTKLPTVSIDGVDKHYLAVKINDFDVNYDSFSRIKLQYKSASESDDGWKTLMNYYADSVLYEQAVDNGLSCEFIDPSNAGTINYQLKMDDLPDQLYDLRAVSVCLINNEEIYNYSDVVSGTKDMYCPRLFGSPQPANGILTVEDEIRLNFNEEIADGLLTYNNFQVTGIRNGAQTEHSVALSFDGLNDYMATEFDKNLAGKDITVEMWVKTTEAQNATLFSHGNSNESLEMSLTSDNYLQLQVGNSLVTSADAVPFEAGTWAHVALVYQASGKISAYYNFSEVISDVQVETYNGVGNFVLGTSTSSGGHFFNGLMHNVRVWDDLRTLKELQVNSLAQMSGNEPGLYACYPMDYGKGEIAEDIARGANMVLNGCIWYIPEGRAIALNGIDSYVRLTTGSSAVIDETMDYTIEFWFKGAPGQSNATLLSNGRGDGKDLGGSDDLFAIELDENGQLCFKNKGFTSTLTGNYMDNDWHHFAINVGRTIGRGQIYIDGELINYFDSSELGGIASAYMYIGACGWYAEGGANSLILDNYFEGSIDELRIWGLYKYEAQIAENNNVKLDGTEMGLLAYYPFEDYKEFMGIEELDFSLADMKVPADITSAVPDAENRGAEQSADIPPVKDKGPVSDLEFEFVVNDDALIITLNESLQKIENTTVTFTVDGVQDVNGNENISPITWSAYIDQNMLKWSETEMSVTKALDESYEFVVRAVNTGGAIQNYTITNMPSWMSISPQSGIVDPGAYVDVTFEIDEGLNVGTYDEVVYLTNADNVSELLELTVVVTGDEPDWTVDAGDYKYNMSVYAKLRIDNIFSKDEADKIAVFSDGKCIGVANVEYEESNDMWFAFLSVYSNETTQTGLVFKIWDASTGKVYLADAGTSINFVNNSIIGTPMEPKIFDAGTMIYQNIDISSGWNWISFNVNSPLLNSLNETLADMDWTSGDFFKSEADNCSANYSETEGKWMEEASTALNNHLMYKVLTSVDQTISLAGSEIIPSSQSIAIAGNAWNYIAYLPSVRLPIDEAMAGYDAMHGDVVKSQDAFAMYTDNFGWSGSLSYLEPCKGYMLKRTSSSETALVYPDSYGTTSDKSAEQFNDAEYVNHDYSGNMNFVAVSDITPTSDDQIFSYVGGVLSSKTTLKESNYNPLYYITIAGNANMPVSFELVRDGKVIGRSSDYYQFTPNAVTGSINDPTVIHFAFNDDVLTAYPNPFENDVILLLSTSRKGNVEITITDIVGNVLIREAGASVVNGQSLSRINCQNLVSGLYFAQVIIDGVKYVVKIEKR